MVAGKLSASGTFTLAATCAIVNDDCSNSILVACGSTTTGSTANSTVDAVTGCAFSLNTAGGVWYRVVGNGGMITVSLCGSGYDTKVGVFTGTCGALTCVTGNDDSDESGDFSSQSQVTFPSTAGTTYLILVTGFSTNTGSFTMNVTCAAPPLQLATVRRHRLPSDRRLPALRMLQLRFLLVTSRQSLRPSTTRSRAPPTRSDQLCRYRLLSRYVRDVRRHCFWPAVRLHLQ